MKFVLRSASIVLITLSLMACGGAEPPTISPPASLSVTATVIDITIPSVTPFPPATLLPMNVGGDFYRADLIFESSPVKGCQLPCWRGLVIGQSTQIEVEKVLNASLTFDSAGEIDTTKPTTIDGQYGPISSLIVGPRLNYYDAYDSQGEFTLLVGLTKTRIFCNY